MSITTFSSIRLRRLAAALLAVTVALLAADAAAGAREQARRLHDRLAGVPPTQAVLAQMEAEIAGGDPLAAAEIAMNSKSFYGVTVKNMVTPWTNEEQTRFAPLNDYTATVIGMVRDGSDFRRVLYDDILYVGVSPDATPLPAYSNDNNTHYETLERRGLDLRITLQQRSQSSVTGLASAATAGVLTSRAASKAFFVAGTNRAMLRFTFMNHMCRDLEQVKDNTLPPDRIRRDVSRSPGGDSRVFFGTCLACHAGMDPLAQAFAYYNFDGVEGEAPGSLAYTNGVVQEKYNINPNNFAYGYITTSDAWENRWRTGVNAHLGWSDSLPGRGNGAKSMGQELAYSDAFAECQVKKVFRTVCLREPTTSTDHAAVDAITGVFRSNGYNLRRAFAETGVHCMGN